MVDVIIRINSGRYPIYSSNPRILNFAWFLHGFPTVMLVGI